MCADGASSGEDTICPSFLRGCGGQADVQDLAKDLKWDFLQSGLRRLRGEVGGLDLCVGFFRRLGS